ncbi:polymorphic toxin type 50 domain-containing protein [Variovorax sp. JS1663]|uniref:polymorphic toxin type 50 domain-containing protein n=1 Tax=Variovorax sp. JS1663 TaxID=1851577 RepID=UPI000B34104D|nr:polymorphic toxin type 50 domain-containing protein [Variovorax sp. JS1663]
MGFAGLFRHERSGFDLAVYRAYDQQRGRWLNRDPMREDGGLNLYGYVDGNPLKYTDRQGLFAHVIGPAVPILGIGCALTPGCRDAMADAIRSCGGAAGRLKDWLLSEEAENSGLKIHEGQQGKHVPGHNNYQPGKSELTDPDPQALLDQGAGTGQQIGSTPIGQPGSKERVDFGKNIGSYVDPVTGERSPTSVGIIHHGSRGSHIVPARPKQ